MIEYDLSPDIYAFTSGTGEDQTADGSHLPFPVALPRQTHSDHIAWQTTAGREPDTDAVITDVPGLCVAVKTADCIPVLLYDKRQKIVAAVHAGWKGTVQYIVSKTIRQMQSRGEDLTAIIGPGISLDSFEVGDEVYDRFKAEGFPMERIGKKYPLTTPLASPEGRDRDRSHKWHLDLWEANRWVLQQCGVTDIHIAGIDTMSSPDFYSARRDTINTGRNLNGIMIVKGYRL